MEHILRGAAQLKTSGTLTEGICQLKENAHAHDIVLLDLGLPDAGTGVDALMRVKEANKEIPVIIITGNDDFELMQEASRHGASDYILKTQLNIEGLLESMKLAVKRAERTRRRSGAKERVDNIITSADNIIQTLNTVVNGHANVELHS